MEPHDSPPRATQLDDVPAFPVGPGCARRDLPAPGGVRAWVVDLAPGARWPRVDHHPQGEAYLVLRGEVIEGDRRFGAGTYLDFAPGSSHRPRSETGARLIGFNPTAGGPR